MSHLPPGLSSSESESYNCRHCLLWPVARCPLLTSVCTARAGVEDRAPCLGGPADTRDSMMFTEREGFSQGKRGFLPLRQKGKERLSAFEALKDRVEHSH